MQFKIVKFEHDHKNVDKNMFTLSLEILEQLASRSHARLLDDFTHMGQASQRGLRASFHEKVMNKHHTISPSSKSSLVSMLPSQT